MHWNLELTKTAALILLLAVTRVLSPAADSDKPDFSGSYTLTGAKGAFKLDKSSPWLLHVMQTDAEIEITQTAHGKVTTNLCKIGGAESPYTTDGGVKGTCTVRFKGKTLILETQIASRPQQNGPLVQIDTKQQWTLSSKTLTIRNDVSFPKLGLGGFPLMEPWSEIYTKYQ